MLEHKGGNGKKHSDVFYHSLPFRLQKPGCSKRTGGLGGAGRLRGRGHFHRPFQLAVGFLNEM